MIASMECRNGSQTRVGHGESALDRHVGVAREFAIKWVEEECHDNQHRATPTHFSEALAIFEQMMEQLSGSQGWPGINANRQSIGTLAALYDVALFTKLQMVSLGLKALNETFKAQCNPLPELFLENDERWKVLDALGDLINEARPFALQFHQAESQVHSKN